jgi:hypothetical protein
MDIRSLVGQAIPLLRRQPPLNDALVQRIVIIGSATPPNIERAVEAMLDRFAAAQVDVVAADGALRLRDSRVGLRSWAEVRELRYQVKVVLFTGEGQNLLKLRAFAVPARRMLVYTEGGGVFSWSFDERLAIWNHLRWRLAGGRPVPATLARLARAVANPILSFVAFVALLFWHVRLRIHVAIWHARHNRG